MRENIFTLTRREQRAIIVIVLVLIVATLAMHYRTLPQSTGPLVAPVAATPEDQDSSTPPP